MVRHGWIVCNGSPGLLLWCLWSARPLLLGDGPGSGVILLPFLFAISAIAFAVSAAVLLLRAPGWHKMIVVVLNASFPAYFGLAYIASMASR